MVLSVELALEWGSVVADGFDCLAVEVDVRRQHIAAREIVRDGEQFLWCRDRNHRAGLGALRRARPTVGACLDLSLRDPVARDGRIVPAKRTRPVGVGRNRAVDIRSPLVVADERADIAARAPHGAGAPTAVDYRIIVVELPDEAAVVAGGGAHIAARHAVRDHGWRIDIADEAARAAVAAHEAVCTAVDDPIDRAAAGTCPDQTSGVGVGRRDLDRRDAVADDRSARDASDESADVLLARDRSRDGDVFDHRTAHAAEESAIVAARQAVRAEEVADGVAVAAERAGERRGFRADGRPVRPAEVDLRAERVRAAKVIRNRREPFAGGDERWLNSDGLAPGTCRKADRGCGDYRGKCFAKDWHFLCEYPFWVR